MTLSYSKHLVINIIRHLIKYQKSFFHILGISPGYSQFYTLKTIMFLFPLHVKSSVTGGVPLWVKNDQTVRTLTVQSCSIMFSNASSINFCYSYFESLFSTQSSRIFTTSILCMCLFFNISISFSTVGSWVVCHQRVRILWVGFEFRGSAQNSI